MADGGRGYQRVGHLKAVRQGVFFNQVAPHVADGLGDGQYVVAF